MLGNSSTHSRKGTSSKPVGVVRFPGTNCDRDVVSWMQASGRSWQWLWWMDSFSVAEFDSVIVPGGFSFGDYLRSGALAARSPVIRSVWEFAGRGGPVLGICNGFQILTEAGLLPGALAKNVSGRFVDAWVDLEVEAAPSFVQQKRGEVFRLPVAHGDGRFYADPTELARIEDRGLVWLRYKGRNPNGSALAIAGVKNESGNVAALMPHPERAIWDWMGGVDGKRFLPGVLGSADHSGNVATYVTTSDGGAIE